jgi:hypothetical protein
MTDSRGARVGSFLGNLGNRRFDPVIAYHHAADGSLCPMMSLRRAGSGTLYTSYYGANPTSLAARPFPNWSASS